MIKEHLKVAFEYWMYVNMKTNYRRETAEEEAQRLNKNEGKQFLKPGYKIIDHGSKRNEHNWWRHIIPALEMETVQIEQNE